MHNPLYQRDLISINDLTAPEMQHIIEIAARLKNHPQPHLMEQVLLANCFFEPSTRTKLSFEAAMYRMGGQVIGFTDNGMTTSVKKGETLLDTVRVIGSYADILVIRHPQEGAARLAADVIDKPVINAGDGANQHPTQTLIDLYTIQECQGRITELHIAICGDLKYGRTAHSLSLALAHYPIRLYFVAPESLALPDSITHELKKRSVKFSFHKTLEEVIPKIDILYMTRLQKERMEESPDLGKAFRLQHQMLTSAKKNLKILHALPRVDEIESKVDGTPFAYYFQQAANGVIVRMALLALIMGKLE